MTSKGKKELEGEMGIALNGIFRDTRLEGFSGRCWGMKGSLFEGSHVTLGKGNKVVSVFVKNGKIQIMEYEIIKTRTALGDEVRRALERKKLPFAK